jgi:hypothetical protein
MVEDGFFDSYKIGHGKAFYVLSERKLKYIHWQDKNRSNLWHVIIDTKPPGSNIFVFDESFEYTKLRVLFFPWGSGYTCRFSYYS